jgi:hypothetical protein
MRDRDYEADLVECYVKILKEEGEDLYRMTVLGDDDQLIAMIAYLLINDERGSRALDVANEYFNDLGTKNKN